MRWYVADLHLHTALSPCAAEEMAPASLVAAALRAGLDILAVTDHNSAGNVEAVQAVSRRAGGPVVLAGLEVQTKEEVHVLCLFERLEAALALQALVFAHLPPLPNREEIFGRQVLFAADGREAGREERCLLQSVDLGLEAVAACAADLGGIVIPAHVERPAYGLVGVLGFLPPRLAVAALEIGDPARQKEVASLLGGRKLALICSSDAHCLADVGRRSTRFYLEAPTLAEIRLALAGEQGRKVVV